MSTANQPNFSFTEDWDPKVMEVTRHGCAEIDIVSSSPIDDDRAFTRSFLGGRLSGPGGLYNLGNLIALSAGILAQLAHGPTNHSVREAVTAYLFGNPGATWLTVAMLIFLAAGEVYHRAWTGSAGPNMRLVKLGDLISGFGALAITAALVYFGDLLLATVAGTLLAGGKFGTALLPDIQIASGQTWVKIDTWLRRAVIYSRFPSLAALALEIVRSTAATGSLLSATMPAIMAVCFLLWLRADVLLLQASSGKGNAQ